MTFPNAYKGLKKVFTAEILSILAGIFMGATGLFTAATTVAMDEAAANTEEVVAILAIVSLILLLIFSVLGILALIFQILGLKKASIDEAAFKKALIAALISLGLSIFEITLNAVSRAYIARLFTTLINVCSIFVIIFVIQGIQNLAEKLNNDKMVRMGQALMIIIAISYGCSALAMLLPIFFRSLPKVLSYITSGCEILSSAASLVGGIIYLIYLAKAIKMLKNN